MSVPMLKHLKITNFKSIEAATIEFENPTYLVGQNGSGKSNITDAITMLSELMTSPLEPILLRRGGVSSCDADPLLATRYRCRIGCGAGCGRGKSARCG